MAIGEYTYLQNQTQLQSHSTRKEQFEREKERFLQSLADKLSVMGFATTIGKYQLGRTIGEGMFAKVKLAMNTETHQSVAVKIIDKHMVMENKLMDHVKREISTMKLLHHPNIVHIYEVIATKTKIYIVMEYISGGQLSDKLSYLKKLSEDEARKYFQQLIDAVDYCHGRGVYHRDLKPENLLLDSKGNLKVSDFGLSVLRKPGDLLSTACGSPCYVAPEVISKNKYDGAAADVWSCGVVLFELLAGFLPFNDPNLMNLYRKILRAEYKFPEWFTASQTKLLFNILNPDPNRRITISEILEDDWFQTKYTCTGMASNEKIDLDDVHATFDSIAGDATEHTIARSSSFINAFQLIAMSHDLDLSGLFEEEDENKHRTFGSEHSIGDTIEKIEVAAKDTSLAVERMNNSKVKIHHTNKLPRCSRSYFNFSAEVTEVTPTNCVIEISRSAGELTVYKEFCRSLSSLLKEKSSASDLDIPPAVSINAKDIQENGCSEEEMKNVDDKEVCSYSSS